MNIYAKIRKKILANQIQQDIKGQFNTHRSTDRIQRANMIEDKNHVIISTDAEKAFDKIQLPFMITISIKWE